MTATDVRVTARGARRPRGDVRARARGPGRRCRALRWPRRARSSAPTRCGPTSRASRSTPRSRCPAPIPTTRSTRGGAGRGRRGAPLQRGLRLARLRRGLRLAAHRGAVRRIARGSGPPRDHHGRDARRHRAVAQPRHRRRPRHDVGPARVPGLAARELRLLARRLRRRGRPRPRRHGRRPGLPRPVRGRRPPRQSAAGPGARALRGAGRDRAPRARVHGVRDRRRRRGVAALPLPDPPQLDGLEGGRRRLQLERRRRQPDLDRREGRHGLRRDGAPGRDRAADRHRDVRARRRLAGGVGRLVPGLPGLSGAAQGDHGLPRPLPRQRVQRGARACSRSSAGCGSASG